MRNNFMFLLVFAAALPELAAQEKQSTARYRSSVQPRAGSIGMAVAPSIQHTPPTALVADSTSVVATPSQTIKAVVPNHLDWHQLECEELACRQYQLPPHQPYQVSDFSYYFRPYQYTELREQQTFRHEAAKNPYDNRFLQGIYPSLAPASPELIR